MAVDLASVHMISRNSPHLNAVCGQWAAVTPEKAGAGKSARWEVSWAFFMYVDGGGRLHASGRIISFLGQRGM